MASWWTRISSQTRRAANSSKGRNYARVGKAFDEIISSTAIYQAEFL